MSPTRSIRRAEKKDISAIVIFNQAMALETESLVLDEALLLKGVQSVFDNPEKGFYLVCEIDGVIVGSLMITYEWSDWRNGTFYWVQSVYVKKEFRRQGIYKSLYLYLRDEFSQKEEVAGMRLYVEKDNEQAQTTYENLGMKKTNYVLFEEGIKEAEPTSSEQDR